jgi:hypothetical protein
MKKTVKHSKNEKYEDDYFEGQVKRKEKPRRPIRNWVKAWQSHEADYDEYYEEFHNK